MEAHVTEAVEERLWAKAIANSVINPLTALWRASNGDVCKGDDRRRLISQLAGEAASVARARGVRLPFEDPVAYVESVCRATRGNRSSMLQDVEHGRPTEIESINGVLISEGKRLGVPTPVNEVIRLQVQSLARDGGSAPDDVYGGM
jgi:2-dehydropantoate 2-reductase